jgi:hypothetical protein
MKARKKVKKMKEQDDQCADKTGQNEEKVGEESGNPELDLDLDDPEYEAAATKIQAGYKGMKARKKVKKMKEEQTQQDEEQVSERDVPMNLDDPEYEAAATKIQAGYKGMQARKRVKKMKEEHNCEDENAEEDSGSIETASGKTYQKLEMKNTYPGGKNHL